MGAYRYTGHGPRHGTPVTAYQLPDGGRTQHELATHLWAAYGVALTLYGGHYQPLDTPAEDGSAWRWRRVGVDRARSWAYPGEWVVIDTEDRAVTVWEDAAFKSMHQARPEGDPL